MLVQGDEHNVLFSLKLGGSNITPATTGLEGLKIQFGRITKEYNPSSASTEVNYDGALKMWYVKLSQQQTLAMRCEVPVQVQVKINGDIFTSLVKSVCVHGSIIKEIWNNE